MSNKFDSLFGDNFSEKDLHPIVVKFLKEKKKYMNAKMGIGHSYVGVADAFGIKDIGGKYNSNVIGYAVEVKKQQVLLENISVKP